MTHWILIGHTPVPADLATWARWFEQSENRRVARTQVFAWCAVSTVCLGLDHRFFGDGPPVLFETMAFWDGHGEEQARCCTWLEAEQQHREMVRYVARPATVAAYCWRRLRESVCEALTDLRDRLRETVTPRLGRISFGHVRE